MKKELTLIFLLLTFSLFVIPSIQANPDYEDFTTYTEVDPNNHLSQTSTRSTFTDLSRDEDTYLYYDKDSGHFDGDFDHKFDFKITGGVQYSYVVLWCLMNTVDDYSGRGNDHISFYIHHGSSTSLDCVLRARYAGGAEQVDSSAGFGSEAIMYYARVKRAGSITTLKLYASASNRDNEIDPTTTLSVNPEGVSSLQYIYPTQSVNIGGVVYVISGYVENLDLQEPPQTWFVTFYFTIGGQFRVNNATITNGTANEYPNGTVLELACLPQNISWVFVNFTWNGNNSTTNPYDLTVLSNLTVWCYLQDPPAWKLSSSQHIPVMLIGVIVVFSLIAFAGYVGYKKKKS